MTGGTGRFNANEQIMNKFESVFKSAKDSLSVDAQGIKKASGDCRDAARQTSATCDTINSHSRRLIDFAVETQGALDELRGGGGGVSHLAAVARAASGDDLRAALAAASDVDDLARVCVDRSVEMTRAIDAGVATLPAVLRKAIDRGREQARENGGREADGVTVNAPPDVGPDVRALEETVERVRNASALTALEALQGAFHAISSEGERCRDMFHTVRDFSEDVMRVSTAIQEFKAGKVPGHAKSLAKDIWRCLRLSDLIRSFAVAAGKVIQWIVKVMQAIRNKAGSKFGRLLNGA